MSFPQKIDDSLLGRIDDAIRAFEAGAFLSALSMALSIPDICGARAFPDEKSGGKRYAKWFDEYVVRDYINEPNAQSRYYFDGDDCYQLRCVFLHEGINAPHVERGKTSYNVAQFRVFGSSPGVGCDSVGKHSNNVRGEYFRHVDLDLCKFLYAIKSGVERFVAEHPGMNDVMPFDGLEAIYYAPVLVFERKGYSSAK